MRNTKKLFGALVLAGALTVGGGLLACGSEPWAEPGSGELVGGGDGGTTITDEDGGVAKDGGVAVADGGAAGACIWGGSPCPC